MSGSFKDSLTLPPEVRESMKRHYRCPRSELHRHAYRTIGGEVVCPDCGGATINVEEQDAAE